MGEICNNILSNYRLIEYKVYERDPVTFTYEGKKKMDHVEFSSLSIILPENAKFHNKFYYQSFHNGTISHSGFTLISEMENSDPWDAIEPIIKLGPNSTLIHHNVRVDESFRGIHNEWDVFEPNFEIEFCFCASTSDHPPFNFRKLNAIDPYVESSVLVRCYDIENGRYFTTEEELYKFLVEHAIDIFEDKFTLLILASFLNPLVSQI